MNIVEYDEIREKLDEVKEMTDFLPDVTTDEGYEKSKRVALDVGKLLTALEKKRKDKKAFFIEGGKQVDSQAKAIAAELEQYQLPHKDAYKELDNLKKEREANRKAELERRVQEMRELPETMRDSDSDGVLMAMQHLQDEECLDFYEYSMQALEARNASRKALGDMYAEKLKSEAEAVELEALRQEKAKRDQEVRDAEIYKAATDAELKRIEREQAEQEKADAERMANKALISKVRGEIKVALMDLCGLDEAKAKEITLALCRGDIPYTTVKF